MSEQPDEAQPQDEGASTPGIDDQDLPEDLQPGEDNPLAEPLEPGETPEVDLNQPSSSYERELEERGDEAGDQQEGDQQEGDQQEGDQAGDGASDDA